MHWNPPLASNVTWTALDSTPRSCHPSGFALQPDGRAQEEPRRRQHEEEAGKSRSGPTGGEAQAGLTSRWSSAVMRLRDQERSAEGLPSIHRCGIEDRSHLVSHRTYRVMGRQVDFHNGTSFRDMQPE